MSWNEEDYNARIQALNDLIDAELGEDLGEDLEENGNDED